MALLPLLPLGGNKLLPEGDTEAAVRLFHVDTRILSYLDNIILGCHGVVAVLLDARTILRPPSRGKSHVHRVWCSCLIEDLGLARHPRADLWCSCC